MEAYCNVFEAIRDCEIFFSLSMHDVSAKNCFIYKRASNASLKGGSNVPVCRISDTM